MTEDRFTEPNNFCPHPEYWHSEDRVSAELEVSEFIASLVGLIQPEFVLETGTWRGQTSFLIAKALYMNGHGRLETLEMDLETYQRAQIYLDQKAFAFFGFPHSVLPIKVVHINSLDYVPPEPIDLAFLDGSEHSRATEIRRYRDLGYLKPGAIVAVHDTSTRYAVLGGLKTLEEDNIIKPIYFRTPRGLCLAAVV